MKGGGWIHVPLPEMIIDLDEPAPPKQHSALGHRTGVYLTRKSLGKYPSRDVQRFVEKYLPTSQAILVIENEGIPNLSVYQIGSRTTTPKKLYEAWKKSGNIPADDL